MKSMFKETANIPDENSKILQINELPVAEQHSNL